MEHTATKTCPACDRQFTGHINAIYCTSTCARRAAQRRRARRRFLVTYQDSMPEPLYYAPPPRAQYEAEYLDIDAETLTKVLADISIHAYDRDIKLEGSIPEIPIPPDVRIDKVPGTNYSIAYHATRGDYSKYFS